MLKKKDAIYTLDHELDGKQGHQFAKKAPTNNVSETHKGDNQKVPSTSKTVKEQLKGQSHRNEQKKTGSKSKATKIDNLDCDEFGVSSLKEQNVLI